MSLKIGFPRVRALLTRKTFIRFFELTASLLAVGLFVWQIVLPWAAPWLFPPDSYEIILAGPMTGPGLLVWKEFLLGVEDALDERSGELRTALTVLKVDLRKRDDQGDPMTGRRLAEELVERQEVLAVIGPFSSSVAEASLGVYEKTTLPVLMPSATNPELTKDNFQEEIKNIFRLSPTDEMQVDCLVEFVKLIGPRLCEEEDCHESDLLMIVIQDTSNPTYTSYIGEEFEKQINDCATCPKLVQRKQINTDTQEYVTAEMANSGAQVLVYIGGYSNAVKVIRQARALEWKPTMILTDASVNAKLAGEVPGGAYVTTPINELILSEVAEPPGFRAYGYDALKILSSSIVSIGPASLSQENLLQKLNEYRYTTYDEGKASDYHSTLR